MRIREATAGDWSAIHPIFAAVVSAGTTYVYPLGLSSEEARALWMGQGHVVVAVEEDEAADGTVLGSAVMGPNRMGRGAHVATASFMVSEHTRGRGVGRALGEHMLAWAGAEGFRAVQFNAVVETNTAAVALWRSLGFTVIGTVPEAFDHPEHGYVGLHVMHRFLP
ncbi:GNAT family N-acetyltransferase [Microlunatus antarcticus]|uniref:L-amino acid N-acyltransferase YncA n=1 Tax=Microlunatus antarcticus TaxID=53388 RepID=A0A7W5P6Y9_9ACTN|nr:L-amino acid N-acyltransferase YncA [Microlunatus antarcticus]